MINILNKVNEPKDLKKLNKEEYDTVTGYTEPIERYHLTKDLIVSDIMKILK